MKSETTEMAFVSHYIYQANLFIKWFSICQIPNLLSWMLERPDDTIL